MNFLIPMAGRGSRFANAGYTTPKPFIEVNGKPMIEMVIENLAVRKSHRIIFLVLKEHDDKFGFTARLHTSSSANTTVLAVDQVTEGAACTALLARDEINNEEPLIIANSDQYVNWSATHFRGFMKETKADGGILTFQSDDPKWSFAKVDNDGRIMEVAEKKPISNVATVGIYYFRHGKDFVKYADQMISKNIRTNNEYYVCPVYNEIIAAGKTVLNYPIPKMWGLGTPSDLDAYLKGHKK